jgi:hypothetical protein
VPNFANLGTTGGAPARNAYLRGGSGATVALTRDQQVALVFLVYLVLPLLAFLVYWIVGFVRRRFLKKGVGDPAAQEGEA